MDPQQTPSHRPGRHSYTGHSSHSVVRDPLLSHLDSTLVLGELSNLLQPLVLILPLLDQTLDLGQTPLGLAQTLLDLEQTLQVLEQIQLPLDQVLLGLEQVQE